MDTHNTPITPPQQIHTITPGIVSHGKPLELHEVAVLLHPKDNVAIARIPLNRTVQLCLPSTATGKSTVIEVTQRISSGHKVALCNIEEGQPVLRYGSIIGYATHPIQAGSHVHSHNLAVGNLQRSITSP